MICFNCKGNGFIKVQFEGENHVIQCKVCGSAGELDNKKYYHQTWEEGENGNITAYYGPPLDGSDFKNYKIYDSE